MTGIACITVNTPDRRIDVGLPDGVPLADLLPTLLRHGGAEVADRGAMGRGWVVRRADGAPLGVDKTLKDQGVRDGDALWIVSADDAWPEPEYDDIAEAIVAVADGRSRVWDARATRVASAGVAAIVFATSGVAVLRSGPPWTVGAMASAAMAVVLLLSGVLVARVARDAGTGAALGAFGAGYALLAGLLAVRDASIGVTQVLAASATVIGYAIAGMVGIGRPRAPLIAALVGGVAGVAGLALLAVTTLAGAAAVILGTCALGLGLAPALAIRLGGLLVPELVGSGLVTGSWESTAVPVLPGTGPIDRRRVDEALARTDDVLCGLLAGLAVTAAGTGTVLVVTGGWPARVLPAVAAVVFILRARTFTGLRHRLAVLAAGAASALPVLVVAVATIANPLPLVAGLGVVALVIVLAGVTTRRSPVSGRLGDIIETIAIVSVLPLVCVILDLFAQVRDLTI